MSNTKPRNIEENRLKRVEKNKNNNVAECGKSRKWEVVARQADGEETVSILSLTRL
jgi:hypothetical protein